MGEVRYTTVLERVEQVVARHRAAGSGPPNQQEIDDVYTDACATVLLLESKRSSVRRRLSDLAAKAGDDATAIRLSRDLARQEAQLDEELEALGALARSLRTAAEWSRDPAAGDQLWLAG